MQSVDIINQCTSYFNLHEKKKKKFSHYMIKIILKNTFILYQNSIEPDISYTSSAMKIFV